MPLVSVIMPSYCHAKYIARAIESVQAQTVSDWELIIIDDFSRDNSRKIIGRYTSSDRRIRTIYHEVNMGIARTVNDGLDAALGRYIALFASDDIWESNKLKRQLVILDQNSLLAVWSDATIIDSEGKSTGQLFSEKYRIARKQKSGNLFLPLSETNYICGQSIIFNSEITRNIRFDPSLRYLNDYKFMLELSRKCDFYFIEEPLVRYRIHGDNSISKNKHIWMKDNYCLARFILSTYGQELPRHNVAKWYIRMGVHLHDRGHRLCARKCFTAAVRNNPRKTSYYKKFLKTFIC